MAATTTTPAPAGLPLTRCRRAALRVGVPVCLALVLAAGLNLVATFGTGSFPVHYTAPAKTQTLTLDIPGGDVAVTGAKSGPATVSGTARYSLARSTVTADVKLPSVTLGYHCPVPFGDCALNTSLAVPPAMILAVDTGGGNAAVDGTAGPVKLDTSGGDLTAHRTSGSLQLVTGGGNIRADGIRSSVVTAVTHGGDVEVVFTRVPDDVEVDTSGGNITLVVPRGQTPYHVVATTRGGIVSVTVPRTPSTHGPGITARSGGGNITIREQ